MKTIQKYLRNSEKQLKKIPKKPYNLYLKTFLTAGILMVCKKEFARFLVVLNFPDYLNVKKKNGNLDERLKSLFEKIP